MTSIREKIIAWLVDEGHEVQGETPPKEAPVEWILRVTAKIPPVVARIVIQQPSTAKDRIVLTLGVVVSPEHRSALSALSPVDRQEIVYNIIRDAYLICPDCIIIVQPDYINTQNIVITEVIYHEELSKPRLTGSIRKLANLLALISAGFNAHLRVVPKARSEDKQPPSII